MPVKSPSKPTKRPRTVSRSKASRTSRASILTASSKPKLRTKIITKKQFLIGLGLVVIIATLYYFRGLFIVAFVNGQPISRLSVISELENRQGGQALDSLITKTLIFQEAKKNNVIVSEQEIADEIKNFETNIQEQGQDLNQLLSMQGMTRNDLKEQIKLQKYLEKLLTDKISVSDQEISDYIAESQELLPEDQEPKEQKESVKEQLKQQKFSQELQTFIDEIKSKAKINYFVKY